MICDACKSDVAAGARRCARCGEWLDLPWLMTGASKLALGLILVEMAALALLGAVWIPALTMAFRDFGGALPRITRLVIQSAWTPFWILALAVTVVLALARVRRVRSRETILIVTACGALLLLGFTWWAAYQPLFELAGAIKS